MAEYLSGLQHSLTYMERFKRCPHVVSVSECVQAVERERVDWCNSDQAQGEWFAHRVSDKPDWGYFFSDANSAFAFKMRFG